MLQTPILFIIFNRPDTTIQVFQKIREIKPQKLYISADGPRINNKLDQVKCIETRNIVELVDWDCEVFTNFSNENLGCRVAVSNAIDWFFDNEECGIILEDDCLPDLSFFSFCEYLLNYYKDDLRVTHISGNNWQFGNVRGDGSYYFSRYPHIWGWATWRRVWKSYYSLELKNFQSFIEHNYLNSIFKNNNEVRYWRKKFNAVNSGVIKSAWSYQYLYANLIQNGLCINPNVNLVSNIGYGVEGANVSKISKKNIMAFLPTSTINEIKHPSILLHDSIADYYTFRKIFSPPLHIKIINKINDLLDSN